MQPLLVSVCSIPETARAKRIYVWLSSAHLLFDDRLQEHDNGIYHLSQRKLGDATPGRAFGWAEPTKKHGNRQ